MTNYRRLGKSGLFVYPLALGTMQFDWTTNEKNSFEVMDAFLEAGGNLIDTADIYTMWTKGNPGGISEEIIGLASNATLKSSSNQYNARNPCEPSH